jgi:hypothetical protein
VTDWRFLIGSWRGNGRLRGAPLTSETVVRELPGGALASDIECRSDGRVVHREHTVFFGHATHGASALSVADDGRATHWRVLSDHAGRLSLSPADYEPSSRRSLCWTLVLDAAGVLVETFSEAPDRELVMLEHVRA